MWILIYTIKWWENRAEKSDYAVLFTKEVGGGINALLVSWSVCVSVCHFFVCFVLGDSVSSSVQI